VGYQFGYSMWGFLIQAFLLLLIFFIIAFLVIDIVYLKHIDVVTWLLEKAGPFLGYMFGLAIIRQPLVHFVFLQKDEHGKRILAINHSSAFFNFQYFMIFANLAIGWISCLKRVLTSTIYNTFILPRLDISAFSRTFENKDNGFNYYVCLLALENVQTNPIVVTFVDLLMKSATEKESSAGQLNDISMTKVGEDKAKRKKVIRNRWQTATMLIVHPYLQLYRKKAVKALRLEALANAADAAKEEIEEVSFADKGIETDAVTKV